MRFHDYRKRPKLRSEREEPNMLHSLWRLFKAGFKGRLIIYESLVISLVFFGSLPNMMLRLFSLLMFILLCGMFIPIFTSLFVSQLRLILAYRKREKIPFPLEITDMLQKWGVKIKDCGIVKGCTAYVFNNSLVLGKELLMRLTFDELKAVIAHEFGHLKGKHTLLRAGITAPLLIIPLYSWSRLYFPIVFSELATQIMLNTMVNIALLAYFVVVMIPGNWISEFKADEFAAKHAGKENMIAALLELTKEEKVNNDSETHPSTSNRVKHLEKLKL